MAQDRTITFNPNTTTGLNADVVRQGEIYDFYFTVTGTGASGLTGTYDVKRYPDDSATVSGSMTYSDGQYKGTLTAANTAALSANEWFICAEFTDADEDTHIQSKVYISKGW